MQIIITHLTRMKPGYICVAGIDPATGKHVRPVLTGRLGGGLLRKNGGVFEIGGVVDLGAVKLVGHQPEVEDHLFSVDNLAYVKRVKPDELWRYLLGTSEKELKGIFGAALEKNGNGCIVDLNSGAASLGNLRQAQISQLDINRFEKIRIGLSDGNFSPDLSVTDIRLYEDDHQTPRQKIVYAVANRISKAGVILAVGLSRPFTKSGDTVARHWLQVNNIHLEEDPLGQLFDH
jgi:hypothetical protein